MPGVSYSQILRIIPFLMAVCLVGLPAQALYGGPAPETSTYVFLPDQSTVLQTGGFAGVHWTCAVEGWFQLAIDRNGGTASFAHVEANATDDSPSQRTLDPNEVFNLTGLAGTVVDDATLSFAGQAPEGSDIRITVTLHDGLANLIGQTIPPPNSADFFIFSLDAVAQRKYGGGMGEPNDPYQIATAADLIALGETPEDYDKHFILTADIDLDPNLPGRRILDKAVIAPFTETSGWSRPSSTARQSTIAFAGVFDGNGHKISRLTIRGGHYLGLFGRLASNAEVRNIALADVDVIGSGYYVGGLVGINEGRIRACYVKGKVRGDFCVGGFAGGNFGVIIACYAQATASGPKAVGGFVGNAGGTIVRCYATGRVARTESVDFLGGFAGQGNSRGFIDGCLWDTQASGIDISACGIGFDTASLMEPDAYALNGWTGDPNWVLDVGGDYPRLAWEGSPAQAIGEPVIDWLAGSGTQEDPYQIATADQLALVGSASVLWDKALVLTADLDVNGIQIRRIGISPGSEFRGSFDGRGHAIRNLTMDVGDLSVWCVGLFGRIHPDGQVSNLTLEHAVIRGGGQRPGFLGALAGLNHGLISDCSATDVLVEGQSAPGGNSACVGGLVGYSRGSVEHCRATGNVTGDWQVGGLIGFNHGTVAHCRADATVSGTQSMLGGLVGANFGFFELPGPSALRKAVIGNCCATGQVTGGESPYGVGGLVGFNRDADIAGCCATGSVSSRYTTGGLVGANGTNCVITNSYARGDVIGHSTVGGLAGSNDGTITACYATGQAVGDEDVGGLAGWNWDGSVAASFWDTQTSGLSESAGGTGKSTAEMQTVSTFFEAGWDFVGETANGTEDIWWILEGKDYPRLWWEAQNR